MKHKISISLEPETLTKIKAGISAGTFRNTSHALEYAFKKLIQTSEEKW